MLIQTENFFSENDNLRVKNQNLKIQVKKDEEKLKHFEDEVTRLPEMLRDLKREVVVIELPPEERIAEVGTVLKVIEYRRAKYGFDSGDCAKTAPPVPSIIPKGIATPELVASSMTQKYAYGLPLYRQEIRHLQNYRKLKLLKILNILRTLLWGLKHYHANRLYGSPTFKL